MWMSARPVGAANTGSARTHTAGTRACAPTASCTTRPAAAVSVSHREGAEAVSRVCPPSPQTHSRAFLGLNSLRLPRSSQTPPITLTTPRSERLRLLHTLGLPRPSAPLTFRSVSLQIFRFSSAPLRPRIPSSPSTTRPSADPEILLRFPHSLLRPQTFLRPPDPSPLLLTLSDLFGMAFTPIKASQGLSSCLPDPLLPLHSQARPE